MAGRAPRLAAETGVPVATLARMERDQQPVALPEYRLIVRALAVDPIEVRLALDKLELIAGGVRMTEAIDRCRKAPI